jgi:hypothetical protein
MEHTLQKGKYYLGDPCFALNEDMHHDVWGTIYDYQSGKFDLTENNDFIIVHSTHYGDGQYFDTKKRKYNIESGTIGLIPFHLIDNIELAKKNGRIFEFFDDISFIYDAGIFIIKSSIYIIEIDTINREFYDEENEDHYLINDEKVSYRDDDVNSEFNDIYHDEYLNSDSDEEVEKEERTFFKKK